MPSAAVASFVRSVKPELSQDDALALSDTIQSFFFVLLFISFVRALMESSNLQGQLKSERHGRAVALGMQRQKMEDQRRRSCATSKGAGTKSVLRAFGFYGDN